MSKDAFTLQYKDVAARVAEKLGTAPEVLLAQWGLETGWGKSIIPGTNNLGNIKDFSGQGVAATDNQTKSVDKYKAYETPDAFADDFVGLIQRRYPKAIGQKTAVGFASALKAGGYAEDPDYVAKVARSAGEDVTSLPATPRRIDNAIARKPDANQLDEFIQRGMQASLVRPENKRLTDAAIEQANFEQRVGEESRPTGFERFAAAIAGNTDARILGGLQEHVFRPAFPPEEGFKADPKALPVGADSDLIEAYSTATSSAQAAHVIQRYEEEQARGKAVMDGGMYSGVALSIAAEGTAVTNWVAPFAAARGLQMAGKGSLVLAQQGRSVASVASAIGENVVSSTAVEAVAQGLQGRIKPEDLLVNLAADVLLGGAVGAWGVRAVGKAEQVMTKAATAALERDIGLAVRAEAQLGANATPTEMAKAMDIMFAKDLNDVVHSSIADVPTESKLIKELPAQTDAESSATGSVPTEARFDTPSAFVAREAEFAKGGVYESEIKLRTNGLVSDLDGLKKLEAGRVHVTDRIPLAVVPAMDTVSKLARKFLGSDFILTLDAAEIPLPGGRFARGDIVQVTDKIAMIRVDPNNNNADIIRSAVHEVGHAVFNKYISKVSPEQRTKLVAAFQRFLAVAKNTDPSGAAARDLRYSLTNIDRAPGSELTVKLKSDYELDWDEFSAEQFVKFMEGDVAGENKLGLHRGVITAVKEAINRAIEFLTKAKRADLGVTNEYKEFFETLMKSPEITTNVEGKLSLPKKGPAAQLSVPAKPAAVVNELMTDPDAIRFGITLAPTGTAVERKQAQAMLALHKQAEQWAVANPKDAQWDERVKNLADNNVFNVASTGLLMLKSESPLVRMIASELLEDASGVAGKRKATAAISKYMTERFMLGNAINDVQGAYNFWKVGKPGGLKDDLIGGQNWEAFNKEVASEIEARRLAKGPVSQDPNIKAAADSLEASYQRTANAQREVGTLGAEGLPETSVGYMPHRMSPKAVVNLTNEQSQIVHDALVDQFVTIEGWDISFSDQLAASYMKRVRDRAAGDYGSNVGGGNPGSASLVEEALRGMDLPEQTIKQHMDKFNKGAANFTKGRIELDLNKVYPTSSGEFRLLDIFETNQIELLRSQAGRASGEVALTKHGVRGKPGLKLLRDAMAYGEDGKRAGVIEKEAYDQIAAEFLNEPFGTKTGKFMERAMAANTLVRLGGIAFNQMAESINAVFHVGAGRAFDSIASIPRLSGEIRALARGEKVDNPFLTSIELAGGAEFGTDAYKIVMPFDSPDHAFPTYGQDTLTLTDRLLRGGGHLQAKLSGWRLIHSSQQRGMAEQIVHKMMRYVREGKDDVALDQFGINADVRAALRADLAQIATFKGNNLTSFDVTKITDPAIREQVIQAVWRGTSQIIQGTYIGERGKWAHDGWMKMLTQFRSFSLTSMEKQWGRQRNSHGSFAAFGMMMGSMSIAAPIYMARTYAASIGRPDQEAFLEERLNPQAVARATLNYIAMSGMAGDFIDLTTAALPESMGVKPTGGRAGVESDFVGNYVLPASSLVNDVWHYAQSPLSAQDAAKVLPMSRLPYLLPFTNLVRE